MADAREALLHRLHQRIAKYGRTGSHRCLRCSISTPGIQQKIIGNISWMLFLRKKMETADVLYRKNRFGQLKAHRLTHK